MNPLEQKLPLSRVMREIARDPDPFVTVGEMVHRLGRRAFGALFFVFAAPNWLPMPPGASTVLGLPLVLLSPQLMVGIHGPWIPRFIEERPIRRDHLAGAFEKIAPWLEKAENLSRPRLTFLFGPVGDRLIGLTCFLLSLVLILPIPLGNLAPAAAIALFGLAMIQRDGVIALIAYGVTAISAGLLVLGGQAAIMAVERLIQMVNGWSPA
jgi:hypothetical protein